MDPNRLDYLRLLARQYRSIRAASTAIVELAAQLSLPKGTEHFLSDVHGEYEAFRHILRNGSGSVTRRIDEVFGGTLPPAEKRSLATLISYPEEKLPLILKSVPDEAQWCRTTIVRLVRLARDVSDKYLRAQVRAVLPQDLAGIVEELLLEQETLDAKAQYYQSILSTIIETDSAGTVIIAMAELIQQLLIAHLHVIGDIFDRGPGADQIIDTLLAARSVDLQWGNHDIVWMGAAAGSEACIANVIRMALRYNRVTTLEHGYGISLLPLASFAGATYGDDPCERFLPPLDQEDELTEDERLLVARMHKAITVLQLKLEAQVIRRRPHFRMEHRLLLDKVDYAGGTISLDGARYALLDAHFPTVDPEHPYELTPREAHLIERLRLSFTSSTRLQRHVRFLFSKGSMYLVHNGNLLFHGCIPLNDDGTLKPVQVDAEECATGKALMDRFDRLARQGYFATDDPDRKLEGMDTLWRLWSDAQSPLFGSEKMATFERYFIGDKETHVERRNPYYAFRDDEPTVHRILVEFGADAEKGHIINGHVPVQVAHGESPVKANGRLLVIDGGFTKAYHARTGIAGYTLVWNSHGLFLAAHHPFESAQRAVEEGLNVASTKEILEQTTARVRIRETDLGRNIARQIADLQELLAAYRAGVILEQ